MDTLMPAILSRILSALPVDSRARAACVRRGWRDALADPQLWEVLEFSQVATDKVTPGLMKGAADRAAGQLRVLDFSAVHSYDMYNLADSWREVIEKNSAALRTVRFGGLDVDDLAWIASAAPQLDVLEATVYGSCAVMASALRNEAPFGPLRATGVSVRCNEFASAQVLDVAAALAVHSWVRKLTLWEPYNAREVVDAFLDVVAATHGISVLNVNGCDIFVQNTAALARLLLNGSLKMLCADIKDHRISDQSLMAQLKDAFGACELTHLTLNVDVSCRDSIAHVLDAVAATPTLHFLKVAIVWPDEDNEYEEDHREDRDKELGRALGVLLARDMPSLHTLDVCDCCFDDAALLWLLAGLSANTHLRKLEQQVHKYYCGPSENLKRVFLDPALKALAARPERSAQ